MTSWRATWDDVAPHFERLPGATLVLDDGGVVRACTQALAGRAAEAWIDRPLAALCEEASRGPVEEAAARARRGDATTLRALLTALEGETEAPAIELDFAPLGPAPAEAVVALARDVTALAREEARLRRREQLLIDTQNVAHFGVWEWDLSQPTAEWSEALYQIYGLEPGSHVPSYEDYLTRVHPDDRERVVEATNGVFQRCEPYDHDERVFRSTGELRYLHTWAHPVMDATGKLVRLLGVCQDITDRKLAEAERQEFEARLRAVFDASPIGIATVRERGEVVDASPALARLLGVSTDALIGTPIADRLHPEDADRYARFLSGAYDADRPLPRVRVRLARGDQATWVRITAAPLSTGAVPHLLLLFEDLSPVERAERADALATSRLMRIQELERDAEWKSTLLSVTSHEMKNPLSPMVLMLEMLQAGDYGPLDEAQSDAISLVGQQAERLSHLVRDIMDMARIEQGKLTVRPRDLDVVTLVRRVTRTFGPLARQWGVDLRCEIPAGSVPARLDPDRAEQVLVNLLANALEFTPSGGAVTARLSACPKGVQLSVEDTGPGLSAPQREGLFRAFTQLGGRRRGVGTGLGLFVSKHLVDAHGGRIWVESEEGAGSTFFVTFPPQGSGEPSST